MYDNLHTVMSGGYSVLPREVFDRISVHAQRNDISAQSGEWAVCNMHSDIDGFAVVGDDLGQLLNSTIDHFGQLELRSAYDE